MHNYFEIRDYIQKQSTIDWVIFKIRVYRILWIRQTKEFLAYNLEYYANEICIWLMRPTHRGVAVEEMNPNGHFPIRLWEARRVMHWFKYEQKEEEGDMA